MYSEYPYIFAKWGEHYRKKMVCPSCGQKSFVPYVNAQDSKFMDDSKVGKCDRADKCGYHCTPSEYKRDHGWNAEKYKPKVIETIKPISTIDLKYLNQSVNNSDKGMNRLKNYLSTRFTEDEWQYEFINKQTVENAFKRYFVGTSKMFNGSAAFWYVDSKGRVLTAKIMSYDDNGHRVKDGFAITWAHKVLDQYNIPDFNKGSCLYGSHLLRQLETKSNKLFIGDQYISEFGIVESEKTAVIASMVFPTTLWLATGGLSNVSYEMLRPVIEIVNKLNFLGKEDTPIVMYPDYGAEDKWLNKKKELEDISILYVHGYEFFPDKSLHQQFPTANEDSIEHCCLKYGYPKGFDLADIILETKESLFDKEKFKPKEGDDLPF